MYTYTYVYIHICKYIYPYECEGNRMAQVPHRLRKRVRREGQGDVKTSKGQGDVKASEGQENVQASERCPDTKGCE